MAHFSSQYYFFGINILTFFVYGLSLASFGVSLQEYQRNINMTMKELSIGVSLASFFGCISCLLAVLTLDKFNRQLQFGVLLIFYGLVTVIYPLTTSYTVYLLNSCLAGLIISYINSIPSIWVVELFPENPQTYVQILHIFFPVGELTGPFLVTPFLNKTVDVVVTSNGNLTDLIQSNETVKTGLDAMFNSIENLFEVTATSDLWIPYMVISLLKWLIAILVLVSFFVKPYKKVESNVMIEEDEEVYDAVKEGKRNLSKEYLLMFSFFVCLIVGIHFANEQNNYNYISTYLQTNGIDEKTAAYGQAMLSFSICVGRLINTFLTMFIDVQYMIYVNFIVMFLGNLLMIFIGHFSKYWAFFCVGLIGLGFSSLYPFLIGFVEQRISMSNKMIALMTFSAGVFQTLIPLLSGEYLDNSPMSFIILNLTITALGFALYLILNVLEYVRLRNVNEMRNSKSSVPIINEAEKVKDDEKAIAVFY